MVWLTKILYYGFATWQIEILPLYIPINFWRWKPHSHYKDQALKNMFSYIVRSSEKSTVCTTSIQNIISLSTMIKLLSHINLVHFNGIVLFASFEWGDCLNGGELLKRTVYWGWAERIILFTIQFHMCLYQL